MDVRRALSAWYEGHVIPEETIVGKHFIIVPGVRYKRHWTSSAAHILVDFYLEHWKWVIGTMLAVIGLAVAFLH